MRTRHGEAEFSETQRSGAALSKHLEAIENRFSKFQIGSTEESLEAIEKEESEANLAKRKKVATNPSKSTRVTMKLEFELIVKTAIHN
jgi:hypothetical protein